MKRHRIFPVLVMLTLCFLGGACKKKHPENLPPVKENAEQVQLHAYEKYIREWLDFYSAEKISIDLFSCISTDSIPELVFCSESFDFQDDLFLPFHKFSPDSTMLLDMYSYGLILEKNDRGELLLFGGEVDSEVAVLDLANLCRMRILFTGPSVLIEDGFWVSNSKIIITGYSIINDNEVQPVIWMIDMDQNRRYYFEYNDTIPYPQESYLGTVKFRNTLKGILYSS